MSDYFGRFAKMKDRFDLKEYEHLGGLAGLRMMTDTSPADLFEEVHVSGLRGRGGAGFSTADKWAIIKDKPGEKYFMVNADEGEPGTFKDRYLIDKMPLLLLEGMVLSCYILGVGKGVVYVRGEYRSEYDDLNKALSVMQEAGWIGENIAETDYSLAIELRIGGGSYVVGDETALIHSSMGYRGTPLLKPPYPTDEGLWSRPTVVNNIETVSCVALVIMMGGKRFSETGSPECPGPKLYSVSGNIKKPGVYELPMGVRLQEVVDAAGGIEGEFKAVQIGGTAGAICCREAFAYKLDYTYMAEQGLGLGSGALIFMNNKVSMTEMLELCTRFFAEESCGQCMPCRFGTKQLAYMAKKIAVGNGEIEDIVRMKRIAAAMQATAMCPFGQSVAIPLLSLFNHFEAEVGAYIMAQKHIKETHEV